MPRYVMSHRRAGRFLATEKLASRAALASTWSRVQQLASTNVVFDGRPEDELARRVVVFDAQPGELAGIAAAAGPDVLIEPELLRWPSIVYPPQFRGLQKTGSFAPLAAAPAGRGRTFEAEAFSHGEPLAHATVYLFLQGSDGRQTSVERETGADGKVAFEHSAFWTPGAILVLPYCSAWGTVVRGPRSPIAIDCPSLDPGTGAHSSPWWHALFHLKESDRKRGDGIRVGICDTGVGPHPDLAHVVDAGAFLDGAFLEGQAADVDSHGTHVAGIVGAHSRSEGRTGIAPACALLMARIFPPGGGASQADVANAIDALSKTHECDLLNLSLGSSYASEIERDALEDAFERGTLAICAAGNEAGAVSFPASYDVTVAVSALGLSGWGPADSDANLDLPQDADRYGDDNLYLAGFSCFGREVDAAGPGVGIVSTVPERHGFIAPRAEMSGTSMASPAVCGALAVLLAADPVYRTLPRDSSRAARARSLLRQACRDVGLDATYEGAGVPAVG
ncbi:MAG: S8 family serine peptidase [Thermoanaerobaculia bacterium]